MKRSIPILWAVVCLAVVSPASADYAYYSQGVQRGLIHEAFLEYNSSTTVDVMPGYGECNGKYWEITAPVTLTPSLPGGEDLVYVYIDDSAATYPDLTTSTSFTASTTDPVWSDVKQGWYNGDDRCIGVLHSPSSGATITPFHYAGDGRYMVTGGTFHQLINAGNPGNWQDVEATAYSPVNSVGVYIYATSADSDGGPLLAAAPYENGTEQTLTGSGYVLGTMIGWIPLKRGWTRDFKLYVEGNDNNGSVYMHIKGYQIER